MGSRRAIKSSSRRRRRVWATPKRGSRDYRNQNDLSLVSPRQYANRNHIHTFFIIAYPTMSMIQIGCLLVGQTLNITVLSLSLACSLSGMLRDAGVRELIVNRVVNWGERGKMWAMWVKVNVSQLERSSPVWVSQRSMENIESSPFRWHTTMT